MLIKKNLSITFARTENCPSARTQVTMEGRISELKSDRREQKFYGAVAMPLSRFNAEQIESAL